MMHLCIGNWRASMTWRVPSSNSSFCWRWSCRSLIFSRTCRKWLGCKLASACRTRLKENTGFQQQRELWAELTVDDLQAPAVRAV